MISDADQAAVNGVLTSGWIAEGPKVAALENAFVSMNACGAACAVSSGTAALFLALKGLKVGLDDIVAVPTYSCSALLNAVNMLGARPVPVDVRPSDFTIDPDSVQRLAPGAKAAIAVHTFGASAQVAVLKRSGMKVIEDCCQSLGGPQGRDGDAAVYSFYATKIVTGGQGGLLWDPFGEVSESARDYREFDCRETYVPRFNLQMTDIQAAMILSQFGRLNSIRARRRAIRERYRLASDGLLSAGWVLQGGLDAESHLPYRFV
ncbi:MAG: DegT/DnrJ/EryC1/StrS family aminotransferase, partial [Afipia sp.]|nr:DegT/DnrJ/EryC1/StrS family aminotransferase [Afipia sp.]